MALRASVLVAALFALALPASAQADVPVPCVFPYPGVSTPVEGEQHLLNAACSDDPDGHDIVEYEWDLDGDGSFETSTGDEPTLLHTFTNRGAFLDATIVLGLRVTDAAGEVGADTGVFRITDAINSWFRFEPQLVNPGDPIHLSATIAPVDEDEDAVYTYDLDLDGDGTFEHSSGLIAEADLVAPDKLGAHPISLRVSDGLGNVSTVKRAIEVLVRHPSRDQVAWLAPENLLQKSDLQVQGETIEQAKQALLPPPPPVPADATDPLAVRQPVLPRLRRLAANRNGLTLEYTGPKWKLYKVVVRLPAARAASYGLARRTVVFARGQFRFNAKGVGRTTMRWTPGAYRIFRKVRRGVMDIIARPA